MTYQEAIEKAYGIAYIRQARLEQMIIAADNGKTIIEDEDNVYFSLPQMSQMVQMQYCPLLESTAG